MRRPIGWIMVALAAILAGCGSTKPHITARTERPAVPVGVQRSIGVSCVSSPCGPYSATFNWGGISITGQTGYYVYRAGEQVADVIAATYTVHGIACDSTFDLGVRAHDGSGGTSALRTISYSSPACAAAPDPGGFFGSQDITGTAPNDGMVANVKRVEAAATSVTGEATKVTMYLSPSGNPGTQTLRNVIYADSGGNPGALLGVSDELVFTQSNATGWYDLTFPNSVHVTAGATYWLGMLTGPTAEIISFNFDTSVNAKAYNANTYTDGPSDPFGSPSFDNERMLVYATVQPQTAPANSSVPTLSGTATVGNSISTSDGSWSPAASSYTYRWQDCDSGGINCQNIPGAASSSYTVADSDIGHTLRSVVTATNTHGLSSHASAVTSTVPGSAPGNIVLPVISGTTTEGDDLTTTNGTWSGSPSSYTYQWRQCDASGGSCSNAGGTGATTATYTIAAGDVGHTMRVIVTATNGSGSTPATSAQTAVVSAASVPVNVVLPLISGSPTVGSTLTTTNGTWTSGGSPATCGGGTITCTYQWQHCAGASCSNAPGTGATTSSYTVAAGSPPSGDLGDTLRVIVTATNVAGSADATSAQTATVTVGGTTVVGTAGVPAVTCSATISTGGGNASNTVQNALSGKGAGWVLCLNNGNWVGQIVALTPAAPGYTIAAAPGQTAVNMAGFGMNGTTSNLLVEGIHFSGTVELTTNTNTNLKFKYDNVQNLSNSYAFSAVMGSAGSSGLDVEYNQIDHVKYCLKSNGYEANIIFSHNVCGPGIGYGASDNDSHYTQTQCADGLTMNNNAFLGPFDPSGLAAGGGAHNNVSHACGNDLVFDNNIIWHGQSRAQTILWGDDGTVQTAEMNNNLIVEYSPGNPNCGGGAIACPTYSLEGDPQQPGTYSNLSQDNNTVIANEWGGIRNESTAVGRPQNWSGMTISNNIIVNSGEDYYIGTNTCTACSGNVSQDSTAVGTGYVRSWTPTWQNTTWTPNNGSPWSPPPSNYYKPNTGGGVTSAMGYQGSISGASPTVGP